MSQRKLTEAIFSLFPQGLPGEIKADINEMVQSQFEQMNLVSRAEFDVQQKVLQKTRQKLDGLEALLSKLKELP